MRFTHGVVRALAGLTLLVGGAIVATATPAAAASHCTVEGKYAFAEDTEGDNASVLVYPGSSCSGPIGQDAVISTNGNAWHVSVRDDGLGLSITFRMWYNVGGQFHLTAGKGGWVTYNVLKSSIDQTNWWVEVSTVQNSPAYAFPA